MMLQVFGLIVVVVSMMMLVGGPAMVSGFPTPEESKENQIKADQKEAAQIKQWNSDINQKANGTMPICKEGQSPLSDWMDSISESNAISGDIPIMKETCVEPEEEIKGAIILFK